MRPSAPGTSSQNAGRNVTCDGGPPGSRANRERHRRHRQRAEEPADVGADEPLAEHLADPGRRRARPSARAAPRAAPRSTARRPAEDEHAEPWRPPAEQVRAARRRPRASLGSPASSTPATIPNASSSSWTLPKTSRLAPATISPDASSTVAVVSTPPGRNVTSGAMSVRSPGSAAPCLTASKVSADTTIAEHDRDERRSGSGGLARMSTNAPTSAPRPAAISHVARRRLQDQAESDRHCGVSDQRDGRCRTAPASGGCASPAQPLRRLNLAPLGLGHELVERRDLVEPQRARELGIDSIVAQPARPNAMISAVGSTTMRASCAPLAARSSSGAPASR